MTTRYGVTRDELGELLDGEPRYRLDQVWDGLYAQLVDPADITNLPKALRARLDDELPVALTPVTESVSTRLPPSSSHRNFTVSPRSRTDSVAPGNL